MKRMHAVVAFTMLRVAVHVGRVIDARCCTCVRGMRATVLLRSWTLCHVLCSLAHVCMILLSAEGRRAKTSPCTGKLLVQYPSFRRLIVFCQQCLHTFSIDLWIFTPGMGTLYALKEMFVDVYEKRLPIGFHRITLNRGNLNILQWFIEK